MLNPLLALVLLLPQGPGTVDHLRKVSQTQGGGLTLSLDDNDQLGRSVANLGDLDGNGTPDFASSGLSDDDGGVDRGAVYVLFLRSDGRVIRHQKISQLAGGFAGQLSDGDQMGRALCNLGDLNGDGVTDLAVGANYDDDGGANRGAVWLLCLNPDGTVQRTSKVSQTSGGFTAVLRNNDEFGRAVASLGDLDGDGVPELAVGAPTDSTGGTKRGAVYILFLRSDGTVKSHVKIAHRMGGFEGVLRNTDWFGFALGNIGDFDGDGVVDLGVGAALDDDGFTNAGAIWLLYLHADGTVKEHRKISNLSGNFTGGLDMLDQFGISVCRLEDLNDDGVPEIAVGCVKDSDGAMHCGAVYVLFMSADGTVDFHQKISAEQGGLPARTLDKWDWFGSALAPMGDFDHDGADDLAIGARNDDDGGPNRGAVYFTFLNRTEQQPLVVCPLIPIGPWVRLPVVVRVR
jgi:hypothetical protein